MASCCNKASTSADFASNEPIACKRLCVTVSKDIPVPGCEFGDELRMKFVNTRSDITICLLAGNALLYEIRASSEQVLGATHRGTKVVEQSVKNLNNFKGEFIIQFIFAPKYVEIAVNEKHCLCIPHAILGFELVSKLTSGQLQFSEHAKVMEMEIIKESTNKRAKAFADSNLKAVALELRPEKIPGGTTITHRLIILNEDSVVLYHHNLQLAGAEFCSMTSNVEDHRKNIKRIISNKVVVGYNVGQKLALLGLSVPWILIRDCAYGKFFAGAPPQTVKELSDEYLDGRWLTISLTTLRNVKVYLEIYRKYKENWEDAF